MAKKQKRRAPSAAAVKSPVTVTPATSPSPRPRPASLTSYEFNPDYAYVIRDLKKIGIMAVSAIALLVALSFFLR